MVDLELTNLTISATIQMAVAPVFLLAGISALLGVMTNRLGRVIDRTRALRSSTKVLNDEQQAFLDNELLSLERRGRFINVAITAATVSALLVCIVIFTLFMSQFIHVEMATAVATMFMICMFSLICALVTFLGEVLIAAKAMRKGLANVEKVMQNPPVKSPN